MTAFPILVDSDGASEGPRVVSLRRHTEDDAERAYEQCVDPLSQQWTTVPIPYTRAMARSFVTTAMPAGWATDQEWAFAVDVDGRYGGTVSLRNEGDRRAEIAYGSHPDVRGTGAIERALRLLLDWGFEEQKLQTVVWWANRGNWASRRLAWRLGFSFDGTVRHWLPQREQLYDGWVGTLLAGEERSPRSRWLEAPTIEGERVRLRAPRTDDADRMVEIQNDPETRHWVGAYGPERFGPEQALTRLLDQEQWMAAGNGVTFTVTDQDDRMIGDVAVFGLRGVLGTAEIGYTTHPDARGRGLTSEALRLAVRHAVVPEGDGGLGLTTLTAHAAAENAASRAVLRNAGFREVGVVQRGTRTADGLVDAVLHQYLA